MVSVLCKRAFPGQGCSATQTLLCFQTLAECSFKSFLVSLSDQWVRMTYNSNFNDLWLSWNLLYVSKTDIFDYFTTLVCIPTELRAFHTLPVELFFVKREALGCKLKWVISRNWKREREEVKEWRRKVPLYCQDCIYENINLYCGNKDLKYIDYIKSCWY